MSEEQSTAQPGKLQCGLVMPISSINECDEQHWKDVKDILCDAVKSAGFDCEIVSSSQHVGIIQKTIIQNLYENHIIVCDVSCENPNVMFELGLRLAFDKPTIIVKDDKTKYSFDTSPIEHLEYPRDLRYHKIKAFKKELMEKVKATYEKSEKDPSYSTFLKHFGTFKATLIETEEVTKEDYIIEEINELKKLILSQKTPPVNEYKPQFFSIDPKAVVVDKFEQPYFYGVRS